MNRYLIGYLSCRDGLVHVRMPAPSSRDIRAIVWARLTREEAAARGVRVFDRVRFF